jgi:hypothetical protein
VPEMSCVFAVPIEATLIYHNDKTTGYVGGLGLFLLYELGATICPVQVLYRACISLFVFLFWYRHILFQHRYDAA